jgi:large subunit ribosomal protein L4
MNTNVLDNKNNVVSEYDLSFLYVEKIKSNLIKDVILWQRSKQRMPIANVKSVSEVSGSTRKIYNQKGTGRARHGSKRRNLFVGGAKAFGPSSKVNHMYSLNKKLKKLALKHSLFFKIINDDFLVYNSLDVTTHKTCDFLKTYTIAKDYNILFIDLNFQKDFLLSCRNVHNINTIHVHGLNVYDIVLSQKICISLKALANIERVF